MSTFTRIDFNILMASESLPCGVGDQCLEVDDPKWCRVGYVCVFLPQIDVFGVTNFLQKQSLLFTSSSILWRRTLNECQDIVK
jgi:hypothetical protein